MIGLELILYHMNNICEGKFKCLLRTKDSFVMFQLWSEKKNYFQGCPSLHILVRVGTHMEFC